ncbi:hypothetical protein Hypma_008251 [Hypsizygus marmoreus]|uniref:Uncharacterized protein n=1 Tax=Hypsizygus marmoreus TaxID=39966 RepID=A0A369JVL4_HYPMA|nr:hypothetical protein Hypma_008251 [Hypsizygus marmoreus]
MREKRFLLAGCPLRAPKEQLRYRVQDWTPLVLLDAPPASAPARAESFPSPSSASACPSCWELPKQVHSPRTVDSTTSTSSDASTSRTSTVVTGALQRLWPAEEEREKDRHRMKTLAALTSSLARAELAV